MGFLRLREQCGNDPFEPSHFQRVNDVSALVAETARPGGGAGQQKEGYRTKKTEIGSKNSQRQFGNDRMSLDLVDEMPVLRIIV